MSETVANVFKYVFMIIGGLLFIMAVLSNSASNLHLGIILTYVAGALTLLLGAYFQQIVELPGCVVAFGHFRYLLYGVYEILRIVVA